MTAAPKPSVRPNEALRIIRKIARRVFVKSLGVPSADRVEIEVFKAELDRAIPRQSVEVDKKLSDLTMAAHLLTCEVIPDKNPDWLGYDIAQSFFENRAMLGRAVDRYDAQQRLFMLEKMALDHLLPEDEHMIGVFAVIRDDLFRFGPAPETFR